MEKDQLIARLVELKEKVEEFKPKGVDFSKDAVFRKWHKDVIRFLRLGSPHTTQEVNDVEHLWFRSHVMSMGGGYTRGDQQCYIQDLDTVSNALDAAAENISLDLIPYSQEPKVQKGHQTKPSVVVHSAETVITGNQNTVSINSLTVSDFMRSLHNEIDAQVKDENSREGLRAQLTALAKHPAFAPLMTLGLKQVLGL